jgi:lipoprotein-anchoring transpeptidase ErfK/SrfK
MMFFVAAALASASCAKQDLSAAPAPVAAANTAVVQSNEEDGALDELDPFAPNIDQQLKAIDAAYEQSTGQSASIAQPNYFSTGCQREQCTIYARVEKSEQKLYLYINGVLQNTFDTSTGIPGRDTPDMDSHPDGRIYDRYTSTKFPGGDYNGLGNMPYAVFIKGGFAIHGTGKGNWKKLGHVASHGCIRIHPDNAYYFNRLVRQYGVANTWVTVE